MSLNNLCKSACLGATAMYFFDPDRGAYRRSQVRNKIISLTNQCCESMDVVTRDFNNRLQGFTAEMRGLRSLSEPVPDDVLCDRIRSKLGRYSSHPRAIEVDAADGRVTLRGSILASEVQCVFNLVRGMAGVNHVTNEMDVHHSAENVPALQGGRQVTGEPVDLMQENWAPTTKFMVGLAGAAFLLTGSLRAACAATAVAAVGLGAAGHGMFGSGRDRLSRADRFTGSHQDTSGQAMGDAMARGARTANIGSSSADRAGSPMERPGFNTLQQPSMAANPTETGLRGDV